jgi:hypothetical protein
MGAAIIGNLFNIDRYIERDSDLWRAFRSGWFGELSKCGQSTTERKMSLCFEPVPPVAAIFPS